MTEPSVHLYLGRLPIVDRQQNLLGFELRFANERLDAAAPHPSPAEVVEAFTQLGLADALGELACFLAADAAFLGDEALALLPPEHCVLAVADSVTATPDLIGRCESLRAAGFRLAVDVRRAVDDLVGIDERRAALFPLADFFTVDVRSTGEAALPDLVAALRRWPARLLAASVNQPAQFATCTTLGFDACQGRYFAQATASGKRQVDSSKVVLMKLLAQIIEDADTPVLENSFKQAPGLSVNLLRLVNSVAGGLKVKISSLRHAITVLGRRQLQRWLQLLLYTDPSGATRLTNPLLQLAATRGRLMELLAKDIDRGDAGFSDHAFVCGVMSLTPALLDMPLTQILAQVSLAAPISEALLSGKGRLGQLLGVVQATELEDPAELAEKCRELPMLRVGQLSVALAEALRWANHIGEETAE